MTALALLALATLSSPDAESVVLRPHTFHDVGTRGMASHTALVPEGWQVEGGAFWANQRYFNVLPSQDVRITAPDGRSVHVEPTMVAKDYLPPAGLGMQRPQMGAADNGYPIVPMPEDLDAWKRWYQDELIASSVEGAKSIRVQNIAVIPELSWALAQQHAPVKAMLESQNGYSDVQTTADSVVLGVESTYRIGKERFEELRLLAMTWTVIHSEMVGTQLIWSVERAVTYRAPKGQLEAELPLLKALGDSIQMTPQWFKMRADLQARLMKISAKAAWDNLEASRKRSQILAQSSQDISDIIHNGYREREAIRDRTQEKVIHSIRGTEAYITPGSTTEVHLPHGYDRVYSNGQGEYLLTNDALLDPNVNAATNSMDWTQMSVRQ